jgi:hypothetical protein
MLWTAPPPASETEIWRSGEILVLIELNQRLGQLRWFAVIANTVEAMQEEKTTVDRLSITRDYIAQAREHLRALELKAE